MIADITSHTHTHVGLEELKQKMEELALQNVITSKNSYEYVSILIQNFCLKCKIVFQSQFWCILVSRRLFQMI